jgi:hypothetical protein
MATETCDTRVQAVHAAAAALVARTTREQALPETVEDTAVLAKVAAVISANA